MPEMTPERWRYTQDYIRDLCGEQNDHLAGLMDEAIAAGIPDIAVSADVGRMLMMFTHLAKTRIVIEVGTLAGYSGIWIARGLKPDGRLITIENEPRHAEFAQKQFERAGVAERVDIRLGEAHVELKTLQDELNDGSVDVVFLDADKESYPDYWKLTRSLIRPGGLIIADNTLGSNTWWIDHETDDVRNAADAFNRLVCSDPEFDATFVPLRQGLLVGYRSES